jgi:hypothetical protein
LKAISASSCPLLPHVSAVTRRRVARGGEWRFPVSKAPTPSDISSSVLGAQGSLEVELLVLRACGSVKQCRAQSLYRSRRIYSYLRLPGGNVDFLHACAGTPSNGKGGC